LTADAFNSAFRSALEDLLVQLLRQPGQYEYAGTAWSTKRYLNIELLKDQQMRGAITA
jgi:hypothetical protein